MTARTWLRRNRVALVALVALVPATVLSTAGLAILGDAQTMPAPVPVASGHRVTEFGTAWSVRVSQEFPGTGANEVPVGSALVAVAIQATPVADAAQPPKGLHCEITLDAPSGARRVTWSPLLDPEHYNFRITPKTVTTCEARPRGPTIIEVVFLAPLHTSRTAGVVVAFSGAHDPVRIRFALHGD